MLLSFSLESFSFFFLLCADSVRLDLLKCSFIFLIKINLITNCLKESIKHSPINNAHINK